MKHSITLNAVLFLSSITFAQEARENKVISANLTGRAAGISIASENGNTSAIVYEDTGNQSIWACVSDGRGIIWNNLIRIDDDNTGAPKDTSESSLIVDGERIYIAWKDKRNGPNDDIFFTASEDSGATWLGANIRINDGFTPGDNDVKDFRIGSGGKDVIAICATNDGEEQLFLTYSNDGGASWSSAIDVTTHNGNADIDNIGMALGQHCRHRVVLGGKFEEGEILGFGATDLTHIGGSGVDIGKLVDQRVGLEDKVLEGHGAAVVEFGLGAAVGGVVVEDLVTNIDIECGQGDVEGVGGRAHGKEKAARGHVLVDFGHHRLFLVGDFSVAQSPRHALVFGLLLAVPGFAAVGAVEFAVLTGEVLVVQM